MNNQLKSTRLLIAVMTLHLFPHIADASTPPLFDDSFEDPCPIYFNDVDGDGFGDPLTGVEDCDAQPPDTVEKGDDCDDDNRLINPDALETRPDGLFVDENCDGVDGNASLAIFVSVGGSDTEACGEMSTPCATVGHGLGRAVTAGLQQIYIQEGSYSEAISLSANVSLFGGYATADWQRGPSFVSQINGQQGDPASFALYVGGVETEIADMTLYGPDVAAGSTDLNSYVVYASTGSTLTIDRVAIVQGSGGGGADGEPGDSALSSRAPSGVKGGDGESSVEFCGLDKAAGGLDVTNNSCGATTRSGGGGDSGSKHTSCGSFGNCENCNPTPGTKGSNASIWSLDSFGYGGDGGSTCQPGNIGNTGSVDDGDGGYAGQDGTFSNNTWVSSPGGPGILGSHGTGGGGGGGAGGCDTGTIAYGGGGGSGGAGGCRAGSAGTGGGGGGASFGIQIVSGSLIVRNSVFNRGTGGAGGAGGRGGQGQPGGLGGRGGNAAGDAGQGGDGGEGGRGGHSGGGGGGAGGVSCAIVSVDSVVDYAENNTIEGGTGGAGGSGGPSSGSSGAPGEQGYVCELLDS